jgi:hypothetical protein
MTDIPEISSAILAEHDGDIDKALPHFLRALYERSMVDALALEYLRSRAMNADQAARLLTQMLGEAARVVDTLHERYQTDRDENAFELVVRLSSASKNLDDYVQEKIGMLEFGADGGDPEPADGGQSVH